MCMCMDSFYKGRGGEGEGSYTRSIAAPRMKIKF